VTNGLAVRMGVLWLTCGARGGAGAARVPAATGRIV